MSTPPEPDINLDLHFLPSWAKQSPDVNRYADFRGHDERGGRGDRGRREGGRPPGRRPEGGPRPARRDGPGGPGGRPGGGSWGGRPGQGGFRPAPERREAPKPEPLPEVEITLTPEEKGVESLARQIRFTGRAYPIFDIAQLILSKPERYDVAFNVVKKADGQPVQALWLCSVDDTLWLSQDEAMQHVLRKHFDLFYQAEKTPTDPPKGTYTFVAQCGLSGVILGPPNFHDYQAKLHKLHAARFGRMPFEAFKAKVRIVRDEAVVKKWIEDQSFRTEYNCLNVPDALKLPTREEAEKHFREVHAPNLFRQVDGWKATGTAVQQQPCHVVRQLLRETWEDQRRFPLKVVTVLSVQFAGHGLQFFKVNKTVTHVSVARPHHLDLEATPVSDGVRRIVQHIEAKEGCNRKQLVEALAPTPPRPAIPVAAPAPVAAEPVSTGETPAAAAPSPAEPQVTPEQTAVISDLHWLIHQGHVIEFANGRLEVAKKPKPRPVPPPKPAPAPAAAEAAPAQAPAAAVESAAPAGEVVPPVAEVPAPEAPAAPTPAPEVAAPAAESPAAPGGETPVTLPPADAGEARP